MFSSIIVTSCILYILCRLFLGERIPQILYKNPSVSVFAFKNEGHPANVMVYHGDGTKVAIDCIGKDSDRILEELTAVAGKPELVTYTHNTHSDTCTHTCCFSPSILLLLSPTQDSG